MPRFLIERNIQGAGQLTTDELAGLSKTSCAVLKTLGPEVQWLESYVTDDKVYCLYIAPNEAMIHAHAKAGGFPADSVKMVRAIVDPTFAGC